MTEFGLSDNAVGEVDIDVRMARLPHVPFAQLVEDKYKDFHSAMISRRTPAHESNSSISFSDTGEKRYRIPLSSSNGAAQDKRTTEYKIKVKAIDNGDRCMLPGE